MMKCKFCEADIPEGADMCPQCGLDVDNKKETEKGGYEHTKSSKKKVKIFLLFLLIIGIIAVLAYASLGASGFETSKEKSIEPVKITEATGADKGEDGMDGDLDGIAEADVTPAKTVSELGDRWDSYTFQINGKVIALPCEYKELQEAGVTIDESMGTDDGGTVSAKGYSLVYFADQKGNTLSAEIINPHDEEKEVSECLVGCISLGDYDLKNDQMEVVFPGGVEIGTTEDDVVEKYGKAGDTYDDEEQVIRSWTDTEKSYAGVDTYFDKESGKLVQIVVRNYGF